jgi:hypothetical protein
MKDGDAGYKDVSEKPNLKTPFILEWEGANL